MKKIISICLCMSILSGCGGIKGLQQKSITGPYKTINNNGEVYRLDKKGHSPNVKMVLKDANHTQIKIPVKYTETIGDIGQINKIDAYSKINLSDLYKIKCKNCSLDKNYLTIDMAYNDAGAGPCIGMISFSVLLFPLTILSIIVDNSILGDFKDCCVKEYQGNDIAYVYLSDIARLQNLKEIGVLDFKFNVAPTKMKVSCDKNACVVLDENNKIVDEIVINNIISINQKKINELIAQDEEAKAEEERELRKLIKLQDKECPSLYRIITQAQRGYYLDPIIGAKTARRFEELRCYMWVEKQLNGY